MKSNADVLRAMQHPDEERLQAEKKALVAKQVLEELGEPAEFYTGLTEDELIKSLDSLSSRAYDLGTLIRPDELWLYVEQNILAPYRKANHIPDPEVILNNGLMMSQGVFDRLVTHYMETMLRRTDSAISIEEATNAVMKGIWGLHSHLDERAERVLGRLDRLRALPLEQLSLEDVLALTDEAERNRKLEKQT